MKKQFYYLLLYSILVTFSSETYSENLEKEITVTASKLINNSMTGSSTVILSKNDIQKYPGASLPEIISKVPGISFKDLYGTTGFGSYQSIDLRGFADTSMSNTLILLNGHKLSNIDLSADGADLANIPINSIERIEIIKGNSASVLYGGNATAGAINIITNQLPGTEDYYQASTTFGSFGQFEGFVSGTKSLENISVTGNSNYIVTDGYRRNNALRQKTGNLEFNFNINPKHTLHFNLAAHDRYIELPGDVPSTLFSIDPRLTDTPRDFATNYGQKIFINSAYMPNNSLEIINDASYRFTKSQGFFFDEFTTHTDADIYVSSYNPKAKFRFKKFGYTFENISGLDLNYTYYKRKYMSNMIGAHAGRGAATRNVYKFSDTNLGLYYNFETELNSLNKIGFGARFQGNWLKASDFVGPAPGATKANSDSLTYDPQYSYHVGYERSLEDYGNIFARLGRSFTYPNVDQRVGQSNWNVNSDFKLRTQTSNDFEIGHKFQNNDLNITNSFYYMMLRAEIYYDNVDFLNKNLEPSKRYGFESSVNYTLNKYVNFNNSFAFTKAKMRSGNYRGNEIPGVPSLTNTLELNLNLIDNFTLSTELFYRSTARMINDTINFQPKIPEYYLVNIGLKGKIKNTKVSLLANNILNKSYYNYAVSGNTHNLYNVYPLPEFNIFFKLSQDF
ncbi:MAG: hypothetical protein CMP38_04220 [Rickettsiales bacterium]|nr:hypothetical protein [Rickettsiales bacterium]